MLALLCGSGAYAAAIGDMYTQHCARCHAGGDAGAPKVGDRAEWARRIRPGIALMYRSALQGIPNTQMAAKGGYPELSDDDVKAVVDYMVAAAALPAQTLKAAQQYETLGITNRDFIRLDRNYDGRLSRDELASDPVLLANISRFDQNQDGTLNVSEYETLESTLERERAAITVDDAALVAAARSALSRVKSLAAEGIKVDAVGGVLTLSGIVTDANVAKQAYDAVRRIAGIKKIDDRLISAHLLSFD
jgi:cytochrome c5